ncbi:hypothetical protein [Chitinophaga eiseniae]|uniref:hypothetical protein n=1 Tax=Chitinophaga eiseniae TaxID=634771 RepID=UPI000998F87E|nr:hypothetical protein [Chitinophaga eiseniae]
MKFYVRFIVVKRYVPKMVKALWLLIIVGLVIFIAGSFIAAIKFLLPYALGGCVLGAVAQNFFDRYKETGACALTDQEIIVASGEEITHYPLSAITDLKLHLFYQQHLSAMNTLLAMWEEQGITCELYGRKNVERRRFRV